MLILCLFLVLYFVAFIQFKKAKTPRHFIISNKNAPWYLVAGSITASCIGASATIGMVSLSFDVGFPAIWWLLSGACGLLVLSLFLAKKVSRANALTMPQMLEFYIGKKVRFIASIIIVVAWSSILAAQFLAGARILSALGEISLQNALLLSTFFIVTYSAIGGQASILRTDLLQMLVIFAAFLGIIFWLIFAKNAPLGSVNFELINPKFSFDKISYFLVILGGSYVICPMLFGRILSAKNEFHAKFGAISAVFGIIFGAVLIVLIALLAKNFIPNASGDGILTNEIYSLLPPFLGTILLLALFCAVVSSADSCLITASSVFCNDILKSPHLKTHRIFALLFGTFSFALTFCGKDILGFLLMTNDIYVSGVVACVFVAMMTKIKMNENFAIVAMICGGILGIIANFIDNKNLAMFGVCAAFVISILGVFYTKFCLKKPSAL